MLKNILNLDGVQQLDKKELSSINGARGCIYACFCHHTNNDPNCCCVN